MTWSPLACGIISGKYENGVPESTRASLKVLLCMSGKNNSNKKKISAIHAYYLIFYPFKDPANTEKKSVDLAEIVSGISLAQLFFDKLPRPTPFAQHRL